MARPMEAVVSEPRTGRNHKREAEARKATARYDESSAFLRKGQYKEAEPLLREAAALNPDDADIVFHLGLTLRELGRASEAEPFYIRATELKPADYRFHNDLGLCYWQQNRPDLAVNCYASAIERHPNSFDARMNIGVSLSDLGRFDEAAENLQFAMRIWPDSPDVYQNMGMTLVRQGRLEEGIAYYDEAIKRRPEFPEAHRNKSYALLGLGQYERAWSEHEYRLQCRFHPCHRVLRPFWNGEPLQGRKILVHAEQGLGDTIQFMRFVPEVKRRGGIVMVLAQAPLLRMVARAQGVDLVFDGTTFVPDMHLQVPLMSLPYVFKTKLETLPAKVPYLAPEPAAIDHWKWMLERAVAEDLSRYQSGDDATDESGRRPFLIGVSWQGNPFHSTDRWRSFQAAELAALGDLPGVRLVNLQREHGLDQLEQWPGQKPMLELGENGRKDFGSTAAVISQLDMVICPDTALAHLAGALGVPVWMPISTLGDWRWILGSERSPWYPTMRVFHQKTLGDWPEVFGRMTEAVRDQVAKAQPRLL